jgi:hypothetical protein
MEDGIQNHKQKSCANFPSTIFHANYNSTKLFFTILYSLCISLSLIGFILDINPLIKVSVLVSVSAFFFLGNRFSRCYVPICIYVGFFAISFLVSSLFVERTFLGFVVTPLHFIPFGIGTAMILVSGYVYSWSGYIVFYSLSGFFFILMLAGVGAEFALGKTSYNGISMVMLTACISLYIILGMEKKKLDLKPAFINMLISIWAIGRSGIIASFVLFFGLCLVRSRAKAKYAYILIISLIICYLYLDDLLALATNYSFFRNGAINFLAKGRLMDLEVSSRWALWTNYFNNLDIFRVIFGVNVETDPFPTEINHLFNYHNSFIQLHLQTGIMGLITMALIIIALFKFFWTNQVYFVLLLALILRGMTDSIFFFNRFDFIPFFFIFYFLKSTNFRVTHIKHLSADTESWFEKTET